ncbi:MAG: adenylate/guanylate cyclase domain-containing protein [Alphaproteobacteria bacterium]|nr:adenylate/guanylate cyclase domain-containing protein [Alphaproteobacteria bacterium]
MTGERVVRRLAAILAADAVGYSRLMGRDENGTLARLKLHRAARLEPALARHGGRLVKLTGDGALVEFASAVDALAAAIEFQQAMAEANRDQPEDEAIAFRVGLHLGDLIVEGSDLYGDGVNIAARLEAQAQPGGIVVSRNVHEAVAGRLAATFVDLGSLALKNIDRPVQAFAVEWQPADWQVPAAPPEAIAPRRAATPVLALPDKPSIAVLPFQNMSGDPEQEYFADGMVEDIITALSRFKSLFVIARNSSFTYKGRAVDIKQVGRELGVRYVLEGSVRKAASRVRITGQLIDCETGSHLWADRFDGSLEDIFELQDQMTINVVGAIAPRLDQAEIERAKRKPVESLDAYDSFLRGRAQVDGRTKEAVDGARGLFYRAIELAPDFATPYGLVGLCFIARKTQGWPRDEEAEQKEARRLASRVQAIGQDDALALSWSGFSLIWIANEYETGSAFIERALRLNPNLAVAWQLQGYASLYRGEPEATVGHIGRALRLNPLDPESWRSEGIMANALLFQGRYEEALKWAARALTHNPNWTMAIRAVAIANALAGNIYEARAAMVRMRELQPALRISHLKGFMPYRRTEDLEKVIEGLRLAGLPN